MAEGGEAAGALEMILEDYFMMEEEEQPSLADKAAEEDEIDLYVNLTFNSAAPSGEAKKASAADGGEGVAAVAGEEKKAQATEAEPMVEGAGDESLPRVAEPQFVYDTMEEEEEVEEEVEEEEEEEEEDAMAGQVEVLPSENTEPHELEDPAVMSAVRGQLQLEREDSAILESKIADNLSEYSPDFLATSKCGTWSPTLRRVPSLSMMEALERVSRSHTDLDFLTSPVQASYLNSLDPERLVFHGRTLKPSSQRFMRQQSPAMSPPVRTPYPFTPPCRTRRSFGLGQMSSYASPPPFRPLFSNANSPTWRLTHTHETPSFSPLSGNQQKISLPSTMTQLHPLHQRFLTQRQRGQERRIPSMASQSPELDPFSALMTMVEKDWVIKVQMLQLQSENPHRDDYYYQEYYRKLEHKQAEKGRLGGGKPDVPKLVTPYIQKVETYESVVRIPGSLGQVTMSTCYSPRRAIDAVHHFSLDQPVGNQRLQVLYRIEKMYLWLLEMEDIQRKLEQVPEEQRPHFYKKCIRAVRHIYEALRIEECPGEEEAKDEFLQILLVGKGKQLVARLLPRLSLEQAKTTLAAIAKHLAVLIKKDLLDETLPVLYHPLSDIIGQLTFGELMDVLKELTGLQPDAVKQSLGLIFGNKFAISLLYLLLSHGERCLSSSDPSLKPDNGDLEKWVDTVLLVARELSQVPEASMVEPLHLPSNLLFLFCRYVDKDTVNRLDVHME